MTGERRIAYTVTLAFDCNSAAADVSVTSMTFDKQSNGRRIVVESYSCKSGA